MCPHKIFHSFTFTRSRTLGAQHLARQGTVLAEDIARLLITECMRDGLQQPVTCSVCWKRFLGQVLRRLPRERAENSRGSV